MFAGKNYITLFLFIFFLSCDKDGTLFTGVSEPEEEYINNLTGDGCSPSTLCYPLEEIYYNFSNNNAVSQDYYKYNLLDIVTGNYSADSENVLELNSFNSSYFAAVPSSSITSGNGEDDIIIVDEEGNYAFDTDVIVDLIEESSEELTLSSNLELVSNNFNIIDYVIWNADQGRYNFLTTTATRDTTKYIYSQDYDSLNYTTLIDTVLTEIYGDIILIDQNEDVFRYFTEYDSLNNGEPIRAKRRMDYKIKDAYVPSDGLMFRRTTDCNDNYRKDNEEIVIFSGYDIDNLGTDASSFEFWCENQGGVFNIDTSTLCNSYCSIGVTDKTMSEFCVEEYENDSRSTGSCYTVTNQVDIITFYGDPGESDDVSYQMTFCDRGNNLFNSEAEYFLDQDNDGQWSLIGQNFEPFEDRNCNGFPDEGESTTGCQISSYDSALSLDFCDEGNRIWDNVEKCYNVEEEDCDYFELYSKADAPDVFMVTYESNSPLAVELAFPSGDYFDSGSDGCFNELEDGNGGCLCEFLDTDNDDNLDGTHPYDVPSCNNFSLAPGETNFLDLDDDGIISIVDVAASKRSPFDYGSCTNGFSGNKEDCCEYYSCIWNNDDCDWNSSSCSNMDAYCTDDVSFPCDNNSDCSEGECTTVKWFENFDPNNDDVQDESNGSYSVGEITFLYMDPVTSETIPFGTYFADLDAFSNYLPYIKESDYIVTKELNYGGENIFGGDIIPIVNDSLRLVTVIESSPIIKSKNRVKSSQVIDQINFDEGTDISDYLTEELVNFYNNLLSEFHIIKTEFINIYGDEDYDYILFKNSPGYIVKMAHPYYHFAVPGGIVNPPLDEDDFPEEIFWQSINLMPDTLLYSYDGNIIDGQSFYSWSTVESDTANYNIQKEYIVSLESVTLKNEVLDPNCSDFSDETTCDDDTMFWCYWDESEGCLSLPITNISDCLLVARSITTTSVGSGLVMELISRTYLKPGYKIVKQDVSILWESLPWVSSSEFAFSILEYKTPQETLNLSSSSNIFNNHILEINDFQNSHDFDYAPFRITPTIGLQRLEIPQNE